MPVVTVNGVPATAFTMRRPLVGAWNADITVDAEAKVTGPVTIAINGGAATFSGTVSRGAAVYASAPIRVVAGADGLRKLATPRHYVSTSPRVILADLLAGAGERLAPSSNAAALDRPLDAWTTAALPVGALAARLVATIGGGAIWRMLPDGTFWIGNDEWPDSGLTESTDYDILDEYPEDHSALLSVVAPNVSPGTVLGGRRVSQVEHFEGGSRSIVWFDDGTGLDRVQAAWQGAIGGSTVDAFYRGVYFYRVVEQSDDLVDAEPHDDDRLPSVSGVSLLSGLPGARVTGATGGRVLIGWHGGDPSRPFALAFDAAASGGTTILGGHYEIGGAGGERTVKGDTLQIILNLLKTHTHAGVTSGGGTSGTSPMLASLPDPRATNVKVT